MALPHLDVTGLPNLTEQYETLCCYNDRDIFLSLKQCFGEFYGLKNIYMNSACSLRDKEVDDRRDTDKE